MFFIQQFLFLDNAFINFSICENQKCESNHKRKASAQHYELSPFNCFTIEILQKYLPTRELTLTNLKCSKIGNCHLSFIIVASSAQDIQTDRCTGRFLYNPPPPPQKKKTKKVGCGGGGGGEDNKRLNNGPCPIPPTI